MWGWRTSLPKLQPSSGSCTPMLRDPRMGWSCLYPVEGWAINWERGATWDSLHGSIDQGTLSGGVMTSRESSRWKWQEMSLELSPNLWAQIRLQEMSPCA